jgi:hypothetical protein
MTVFPKKICVSREKVVTLHPQMAIVRPHSNFFKVKEIILLTF